MKNKDEIEGTAKNVKGQAKETAGEMTDNERLEREGAADQAEGRAQEKLGEGKRRAGQYAKRLDRERQPVALVSAERRHPALQHRCGIGRCPAMLVEADARRQRLVEMRVQHDFAPHE